MQTIDGDEFIMDKECIILLYCNKSKWGDTENHYDLLHPKVHLTCKTKTYSRRSDLQQIEHQQQEDTTSTDNHRQTHFGEEKTNHTELSEADKLGPKEEGSRMRDCTARQTHDEHNKRHNGILYKQEKEDGTQITSTNLSGSPFYF
eukprot:13928047-Heterocapsa_arctica.AAC.1